MKKALVLSMLALSTAGVNAYTINDSLLVTGSSLLAYGTIVANNGIGSGSVLNVNGISQLGYNTPTSTYSLIVNNVDQSVIMTKPQGDILMGQFGN